MAVSEEEIKLILNTQDSSTQVHQLATQVQFLHERMEVLAKDFNEGRLTEDQYVRSSAMVTDMLRDRAALTEEVARATGVLEKSHHDMGQTMLQASYAVQDFTSQLGTWGLAGGLAAVQNNIPGILLGLGAGAGLTGVLSVLTVGLGAALPMIEKFFGGIDPERAKEAAEHIKAMADAAKSATTAPKTDVEKDVTAEFQRLAGMGIDVRGAAAAAIAGGPGAAVPTYEQEMGVQRYRALGGALGPGGAAAALGLATSPEQLRKQLNDANVARAGQLVGEAQQPGEMGKRARNELRRLSRDNPGAFPPEFNAFLASVEETAPERRAAEAAIEEGEGAAFPSGAPGRERRNAALEAEQQAKKRADQITQTYIEDEKLNQQELAKQQREKEQAAREHAAAAREAEAEKRKAARAADPSNRLAAMGAAQEDAVTSEAMSQWSAAGGLDPSGRGIGRNQLRSIISDAVNRLPDTGGDVAMAVHQAAAAGYQKSQADLARQLHRMQQGTESRLGP